MEKDNFAEIIFGAAIINKASVPKLQSVVPPVGHRKKFETIAIQVDDGKPIDIRKRGDTQGVTQPPKQQTSTWARNTYNV